MLISSKASRIWQQSGVALITAMLVLVLAASVAVMLTQQQQVSIRRTANIIQRDQAYWYSLAAEALAITILYSDRKNNEVDSFADIWATLVPPLPVDGGAVGGAITDLQGRFNLNNLLLQDGKVDQTALQRFERLLEYYELDPQIAQAVIDWIDADVEPSGFAGAEDDYYLGLEVPYRAANVPLQRLSELRLIRGFDVPQLAALQQNLTVLPIPTNINLNTAAIPVLVMLGLDSTLAEELAGRPPEPTLEETETESVPEPIFYETVADFVQAAGLENDEQFVQTGLAVASAYFLVRSEALIGQSRYVNWSVLHRAENGRITVLQRSESEF